MPTPEFETLLFEQFGDLTAEELNYRISFLISYLDPGSNVKEIIEEQHQLGIKMLDALIAGHAQDYQQAREWVELQTHQPAENSQSDTTTGEGECLSGRSSIHYAWIEENYGLLYELIEKQKYPLKIITAKLSSEIKISPQTLNKHYQAVKKLKLAEARRAKKRQ